MQMVRCPRCSSASLHVLKTHSFCVDCNYSPDLHDREEDQVTLWALQKVKNEAELEVCSSVELDSIEELLARFPELSDLCTTVSENKASGENSYAACVGL